MQNGSNLVSSFRRRSR